MEFTEAFQFGYIDLYLSFLCQQSNQIDGGLFLSIDPLIDFKFEIIAIEKLQS